MKKKVLYILLSLLTGFMTGSNASAQPSKVIIVRHGEKDPPGGDNLNCMGLNRSLALPGVLSSMFGTFSYIFVPTPSTGGTTTKVRMLQTATPFAVQNNLEIDSKHSETDASGTADAVMKRTGTVLLVWEHSQINNVAHALGVPNSQMHNWDDSDFNTIYIITNPTTKSGKSANFAKSTEGLFKLSSNCPQ